MSFDFQCEIKTPLAVLEWEALPFSLKNSTPGLQSNGTAWKEIAS